MVDSLKTYLVWASAALAVVSFALAALQAGALWLIPATFGAPALALLLWRVAKLLWTWRTRVARFPEIERERDELRGRLAVMDTAAQGHVEREQSAWGRGVIEGISRYHGAVLGEGVKSIPDIRHTVVTEGNVTVIAAATDEVEIRPNTRFTLVSDATNNALGVLSVTEVSPDRRLTMVCVEELDPDYWAGVRMRRPDEQGPLRDVHLERYSQFRHHPHPVTGRGMDTEHT